MEPIWSLVTIHVCNRSFIPVLFSGFLTQSQVWENIVDHASSYCMCSRGSRYHEQSSQDSGCFSASSVHDVLPFSGHLPTETAKMSCPHATHEPMK